MRSNPRQPIFRDALTEVVRRYRPDLRHEKIRGATGPTMFAELVRRHHIEDRVLGGDRFMPLDWRRGEALSFGMNRDLMTATRRKAINEGAYAITYWTGNWAL